MHGLETIIAMNERKAERMRLDRLMERADKAWENIVELCPDDGPVAALARKEEAQEEAELAAWEARAEAEWERDRALAGR